MSREIKFRIWNNNTNRYEYTELDYYFVIDQRIKAYEYEQYTGLNDKNGKEIYEGDIVEQFVCGIHQFKGKKCGRSTIWQVRWNKEECCFELHYLRGSLFGDSLMSDGDEYEVIGNIHENEESLGGEEWKKDR